MRLSRRMVVNGERSFSETTETRSFDVATQTYRYTNASPSNAWATAGTIDTTSPVENYVGHKTGDSGVETSTILINLGSYAYDGDSIKLLAKFYAYAPSINFQTKGFRWALCSSQANRDLYKGQTAVTSDPYQIVSGTSTFTYDNGGYEYNTLTIDSDAIPSDTDLFLFLWPNGTYTDVAHIRDNVDIEFHYYN